MKPALFDRIQEHPVGKYATVEELYESVFQEILCILDKQSISSVYERNLHNIISYVNPYDKSKMNEFAFKIQKDIEEYEPRLLTPLVNLGSFDKKQCNVEIYISGRVEFENQIFDINFSSPASGFFSR